MCDSVRLLFFFFFLHTVCTTARSGNQGHTRSYTPKRWQKPHTRTHTLESDKGHTHILHSKTGGAGWISLRGCIKTDGRKPTPRRQERRE